MTDDNDFPVAPQAIHSLEVYRPLNGDDFDKLSTKHLKQAGRLFQNQKKLSTDGGKLYTSLSYAHYGCTNDAATLH